LATKVKNISDNLQRSSLGFVLGTHQHEVEFSDQQGRTSLMLNFRCHVYLLVNSTIQSYLAEISDRYQDLRKSVKGKDAILRILFRLTRILSYELVKETRID
jgi:hypothetical protein